VIVVEGTLDAMAIAVAAISLGQQSRYVPVTQSGRELSDFQLQHLLAISGGPIVVAFDADQAGRDSNKRLAASLGKAKRAVMVARLPDGEDPASLVGREGAGALPVFF
jgi:DNA primase